VTPLGRANMHRKKVEKRLPSCEEHGIESIGTWGLRNVLFNCDGGLLEGEETGCLEAIL
jgi:hypothetical protein